ncbi:hypothetical protein H0H87_000990 [Tephrocybe sp. NHM501043]|nr:hypothetical protein H0H87_000990 [Tephrocybe sp. NHM501043]
MWREILTGLISSTLTLGILNSSDGLTISTQQGSVHGSIVLPGVRGFLGIPYAVAGRWEAPSAPPTRNATLEATVYGDSCVQNLHAANLGLLKLAGFSDSQINVPQSENCLTANVWTPSVGRMQKSAAVIVFVYGGGGQFGTRTYLEATSSSNVQGETNSKEPQPSSNVSTAEDNGDAVPPPRKKRKRTKPSMRDGNTGVKAAEAAFEREKKRLEAEARAANGESTKSAKKRMRESGKKLREKDVAQQITPLHDVGNLPTNLIHFLSPHVLSVMAKDTLHLLAPKT